MLGRKKALRNHVEDAGIVEVVPQRVVEVLQQVGVFRILVEALKSGTASADFFYSQSGAGLDPILRDSGSTENQSDRDEYAVHVLDEDLPRNIISCILHRDCSAGQN